MISLCKATQWYLGPISVPTNFASRGTINILLPLICRRWNRVRVLLANVSRPSATASTDCLAIWLQVSAAPHGGPRETLQKPYPEIEAFESARPPYPREVWDASRFSPLSSLIRRLYLAHTASEIMTTATDGARSLLLADGVTFVLKDGDFSHYAEENAISPLWKGRRFPMHDCISG